MEQPLSALLERHDDGAFLLTLYNMELPGYSFFEGVSVPSKTEVDALLAARQREQPKSNGDFTIWRNPDSRFSTLARGYMNAGAASLLVYIGKTKNWNFVEPRIVRYKPTNDQPQVFVIGTPSDKESGLVMMFRPLEKTLCSDDGFFEIYSGLHKWSKSDVEEWFRQSNSGLSTASKWDPITVNYNQVLLVHAGTLVRFGYNASPCDFVCMGYSDGTADFSRRDIEFERFVVPFLQQMPESLRERILSCPAREE
ncbi:hypothetical protein BBP40_004066 [Aspergillus hancockii]|nr:hypothetical protein BBP40_004066 [Aspergillus hancockii]